MHTGAHLAQGFWRLDFSSRIYAWVRKAGFGYQNAYWGSSGKRVFGGEIFVAKSTLGLKKQFLSLRMPSGAHLAKGFWQLEFCSKIDAWAQKAGSVFENAYWAFSGKGLLSVRVF